MADSTQKKGILGFFQRIGAKIGKTFLDIRSELKKVVWPDWQKLRSSTMTVVLICLFFGVVIWVVDFVLGSVLESVGFFSSNGTVVTATPSPAPTSAVSVSPGATPTVTVTVAPTATPAA